MNSNRSPAEAEQVLGQICLPPNTGQKGQTLSQETTTTLAKAQRDKQTSYISQSKSPGEPAREPRHAALVPQWWAYSSCPPSAPRGGTSPCPRNVLVSVILNFSHSPLWKQTHNSFIYSTMSAASVTKLPFPFCRIPVASFTSYSLSTWSLSYLFSPRPIFIVPSIFATLMPPLTFSSLFCNLFRSPLSLIFHNSRVLCCPSSHLKVPVSCICLILLLQQSPALIPVQWQNSYWFQRKWGSWSIYGFAQHT